MKQFESEADEAQWKEAISHPVFIVRAGRPQRFGNGVRNTPTLMTFINPTTKEPIKTEHIQPWMVEALNEIAEHLAAMRIKMQEYLMNRVINDSAKADDMVADMQMGVKGPLIMPPSTLDEDTGKGN